MPVGTKRSNNSTYPGGVVTGETGAIAQRSNGESDICQIVDGPGVRVVGEIYEEWALGRQPAISGLIELFVEVERSRSHVQDVVMSV